MMLKSVDLPQPDGPITATNSPWRTSSETVSSAWTMPSCGREALGQALDLEQRP